MGVGVLLLDLSVKMEIIDFLQPKIKEKLCENIILTPEKCVIVIFMLNLHRRSRECYLEKVLPWIRRSRPR